MKPFIINRSSWHFKLVSRYHATPEETSTCMYAWRLVSAMLLTFFLCIIVVLGMAIPIDFAVWAVRSVWYWKVATPGIGALMMMSTMIFVAFALVGELISNLQCKYISSRMTIDKETEAQPGIFSMIYRSTLGRFCLPTKYVD